MKRLLLLVLKILGGLVAFFLILLITAAILLNTSSVQQKLLSYSTGLLKEKLQTEVRIDSVSVNFLAFNINLMGLDVEDLQQRKMLQARKLALTLDLWELTARKVKVSKAGVDGVKVRLYQPEDSVANYQFVIDAFKSDKPKAKQSEGEKQEKKRKLSLDVIDLKVAHIDIV